jgi:hypothetical protein
MATTYDNELIEHINEQGIKCDFFISKHQNSVAVMEQNFCFRHGRVDFTGYKNERYVKSTAESLAMDAVRFVDGLVQENICSHNEKITYIGDNLTENEYEFYMRDILKILPFLMNAIPQHHYFLFEGTTRLIFISFENELQFGMI